MAFGEPGEHLVDASLVAAVLAVAGLGEFVGVAGPLDAVADGGIGVVAQPVRRLHDVRVGVVDDAVGDVGHGTFCSIRSRSVRIVGQFPLQEHAMNDDHDERRRPARPTIR